MSNGLLLVGRIESCYSAWEDIPFSKTADILFSKRGSLAKSCFSLVKSCFTLGTMGCLGQCSTGGVWGTGQGGNAPQDLQPEGVALQWGAGNRVEGVYKRSFLKPTKTGPLTTYPTAS